MRGAGARPAPRDAPDPPRDGRSVTRSRAPALDVGATTSRTAQATARAASAGSTGSGTPSARGGRSRAGSAGDQRRGRGRRRLVGVEAAQAGGPARARRTARSRLAPSTRRTRRWAVPRRDQRVDQLAVGLAEPADQDARRRPVRADAGRPTPHRRAGRPRSGPGSAPSTATRRRARRRARVAGAAPRPGSRAARRVVEARALRARAGRRRRRSGGPAGRASRCSDARRCGAGRSRGGRRTGPTWSAVAAAAHRPAVPGPRLVSGRERRSMRGR